MTIRRRTVLAGLPALISRARAQDVLPAIKIGVLWDRSGEGAVTSGLDQMVAARLAVEDFGHLSRGYPVEIVDAEFQQRPEQAVDIAKGWFERDQVAVIVDMPGTTAPVLVQQLASAHDRAVMNTGSFDAALTGASCTATATHWLEDTRALTTAMTLGLAADGVKTWYLVVPDDVTGLAFQTGATAAIESAGGRVVGFSVLPAGATQFTLELTNARQSGADAVGLCAMGRPLAAQIRAARELGLFDRVKAVCAYAVSIKDVHEMGPLEARDLCVVTGFYWDQNNPTRAFSSRFKDVTGRMPDKPYAATYAAIRQFLRIVEVSDTIDGVAVNTEMRREPVYFFGADGRIRLDGRLLLDVGLYRVKPPDEVTAEWDYYKPIRTISAMDVYPPAVRGVCGLLP